MDDLTHIVTFCRTVETGSITEAAKSLHLTKSVASRRLTTLEENLGVALLKRSPRGATATEAGEVYYARARLILDQLDAAREEVTGIGSDLVGRLKVTAPRSLGDILLNPAFARFMLDNPGIQLDLNLSDKKVDIIGEGYDLGLRAGTLRDSSLIGKKLADMTRAVVASPDYLARHGTPTKPEDLQHHRCIFYANMEARRQWRFVDASGAAASVKVQGQLVTNSGEMQVEAALAGAGLTILPMFFVRCALDTGQLVQVLAEYTQDKQGIYALYPPSRQQSTKVRALVTHLAAFCKQDSIKACF